MLWLSRMDGSHSHGWVRPTSPRGRRAVEMRIAAE
nr:MAG TPA: hypothetical protein [Caudoviricetes sp.]